MASAKKRLVVGNWKMYVESAEAARNLAAALRRKAAAVSGVDVWVAPPAPFISILAGANKATPVQIGAQTVSEFFEGAHTGEVSARTLKEAGASFVIIGHSERRAKENSGGENDATVNAELKNALGVGIRAILCVGEHTRDEHGGHFEYLSGQLRSALQGIPLASLAKLVIAYEPVWAIGKSAAEAAKPEIVRESSIFIRKTLSEIVGREAALRMPVLYGGSVDGTNAAELIEKGDVAGFLVGRASAGVDSFLEIIAACTNASASSPTPLKLRRASKTQKTRSKQAPKNKRKKAPKKRR